MSSIITEHDSIFKNVKPFGGQKKLYNIVPVEFRTNYVKHDSDARELHLRVGDEVIVETSRGPAIARVTGPVQRKVLPLESIPRVLRKATEADSRQAGKNEEFETSAYRFGIERIRTRKLPMKLIRAQYMHDGSKVVFYFSADGRIDFRDLVKDLAHKFRTRIEMHQIGVRDGARMLGGIGPCGRELCCSTFLENFEPVSIRMAKDQGLTLNPKKVSGMCGRLMCCLVYEQALYRRMRTKLPRSGQQVKTDSGSGEIIDVDVINRRVTVRLQDNTRRLLEVAEVAIIDPNKVIETVDDDAKDSGYLWDDVRPEGEKGAKRRSSGGSKRRVSKSSSGRRRRGSRGRKQRADSNSSGKAAAQTSPSTAEAGKAGAKEGSKSDEASANKSPSQGKGKGKSRRGSSKNRRRRGRRKSGNKDGKATNEGSTDKAKAKSKDAKEKS